jgi:hypothetical protein
MSPNKIDIVCIIKFDNDVKNKKKILPHYIKLCRIIKTYYNKIIIKSNLLLDESLSIDDIDKRAFFMNKRTKLYSEHTNTDHTQDLINLLIDDKFRKQIDYLHSNLSIETNNNDTMHSIIENMFNDKIGEIKKSICPVKPSLKPSHCKEPPQETPPPDITGKQYLILDLLYTIYNDKHDLYTTKNEKNPNVSILEARYNNNDKAVPGLYTTAQKIDIP